MGQRINKAAHHSPLIIACFIVTISSAIIVTANAFAKNNQNNEHTSMTKRTSQTTSQSPIVAVPTMTKKGASKKVAQPASPPPSSTPVASFSLKGSVLYTSPDHSASITNSAGAFSDSSDSAILGRLATKPTAAWFGGWSGDIQTAVNSYVGKAAATGSIPVMVAYNIPFRDCGGESAGGVSDQSSYSAWIQGFAAGIAGRQAIVILEPDAIAAECFNSNRATMLSDAVRSLQSSGAHVYLDGGNPTWHSASTMAQRLKQAGVASATGFSLNVSNFQSTSSNIEYGKSVSALTGGKHFVVDTSRNGNGPTVDYQWCNPAGRALGPEPTTVTSHYLLDALLWIKVPGESDGYCGPSINGSNPPGAGTFWPQYALQLARNAGW